MKNYSITITSCQECATIQIRDGRDYFVENVSFNKYPYFPIRKIVGMVIKIKWNRFLKRIKKTSIAEKLAQL